MPTPVRRARVSSLVSSCARLCLAVLACAGPAVGAAAAAAGATASVVDASGRSAAGNKPGGYCDLTVEGPVCMMANRRVLLPSAAPAHLAGHWTFDDAWPTDSSGNGLHAATPAAAGVGVAHVGFSGSFDRSEADFVPVQVPDEGGRLVSADSTLTFWLFVVRPPPAAAAAEGADCALVLKGDNGNTTAAGAALPLMGSPGVYLSAVRNRLAFVANRQLQHSRARVAAGRWTHVAVVRYAAETSLYVNGVLDSKVPETSPDKTADGPLILGGAPVLAPLAAEGSDGACARVHVLLDEVRLYTAALPAWAVEAEASPALGGVPPRFARLGCTGCSRAEAADACAGNYHLCTETELFSGALQVARALGYVDATTVHTWRASSALNAAGVGVGMCCTNA